MVSLYSVFSSVIFFNLTIVVVAILRRRTSFLVKCSNNVLVFSAVLALLRLFIPLDFGFAYVVQSEEFMPNIVNFLNLNLLGGNEYLKLSTALLLLWIFIALAILFVKIKCLISDVKAINKNKTCENGFIKSVFNGMNFRNARLVIFENPSVPMVGGFFRATIYAPNMELTQEQWQHIFTHEYSHFKNHDAFIKLFYMFLTAIFWWNPLVHKFQRELNRILELRCDESVCKGLKNAEIVSYLQSILAVAKEISQVEKPSFCGSELVASDSERFLIQRFKIIADGQKSNKTARRLAYVFVVLIFLSSYLVILQPASYPVGNKEETGVSVSPENAYILLNDDGSMELIVDDEFYRNINEHLINVEPFSRLKIYEKEN